MTADERYLIANMSPENWNAYLYAVHLTHQEHNWYWLHGMKWERQSFYHQSIKAGIVFG